MKPVVDRLREQYAGKVDVKRMSLDGDDKQAESLAQSAGIQYVPTFVFVDAQGARRDFVVGEMTEAALTAKLDALLK